MTTAVVSGQQTNGTIAGSVVDASGAAIPDAVVIATSNETNQIRRGTTSKEGAYRIESLPPGHYKIEVTAPSFSPAKIENTEVNASAIASVNVTLTVGSTSVAVEVDSGAAALLNTESGQISDTISTVELNNLPIANLNPYSLAITLPGVSQVSAADFTNGTSYAGNGSRPRSNNFLIEGVDNNDQGIHGQAFQPENIEAFDETTFLLKPSLPSTDAAALWRMCSSRAERTSSTAPRTSVSITPPWTLRTRMTS